ncbi:unnamed protein product, partial [Rotaria magnacalcarata]
SSVNNSIVFFHEMADTDNSSSICIADSPPYLQVKQTFTGISIEMMLK